MQATRVDAHDKAGDDLFDDLAKGQRHDGQVVAAQAKDRDADQEAQDGGGDGADHDADDEAHRIGGNGALEGDGGNDARVGTDAHKARVAQRQVARDTDNEVKRDGHDDVGRNGNQLTGDHARDHVVGLHKEHDGEGHDAHGVRDKVVTRLLVFKELHNAHLHLLGDVLAQEAGRLDEQDDDQNTKDDGVGKARGNVGLCHCLDDADENTADKGAGD